MVFLFPLSDSPFNLYYVWTCAIGFCEFSRRRRPERNASPYLWDRVRSLTKLAQVRNTPIDKRWERERLHQICCRERWTCSFCELWPVVRRTATASPNISRVSPKTCFRWEKAPSIRHYSDCCSTAGYRP